MRNFHVKTTLNYHKTVKTFQNKTLFGVSLRLIAIEYS